VNPRLVIRAAADGEPVLINVRIGAADFRKGSISV
jgi:hypothetical protein